LPKLNGYCARAGHQQWHFRVLLSAFSPERRLINALIRQSGPFSSSLAQLVLCNEKEALLLFFTEVLIKYQFTRQVRPGTGEKRFWVKTYAGPERGASAGFIVSGRTTFNARMGS
jgi:hypothetical protein